MIFQQVLTLQGRIGRFKAVLGSRVSLQNLYPISDQIVSKTTFFGAARTYHYSFPIQFVLLTLACLSLNSLSKGRLSRLALMAIYR